LKLRKSAWNPKFKALAAIGRNVNDPGNAGINKGEIEWRKWFDGFNALKVPNNEFLAIDGDMGGSRNDAYAGIRYLMRLEMASIERSLADGNTQTSEEHRRRAESLIAGLESGGLLADFVVASIETRRYLSLCREHKIASTGGIEWGRIATPHGIESFYVCEIESLPMDVRDDAEFLTYIQWIFYAYEKSSVYSEFMRRITPLEDWMKGKVREGKSDSDGWRAICESPNPKLIAKAYFENVAAREEFKCTEPVRSGDIAGR